MEQGKKRTCSQHGTQHAHLRLEELFRDHKLCKGVCRTYRPANTAVGPNSPLSPSEHCVVLASLPRTLRG